MTKGLRGIRTLKDFEFENKVTFLRLDLNVPIKEGIIQDETRIQAALPTLFYLLEKGAKCVVASHLGRPKSASDKSASLEPIAIRLTEILSAKTGQQFEVILSEDPRSDAVKSLLMGLKKNQMILLENVRYEPGETENSDTFAEDLASFTEIYINDAFGASHRAHATIEALPKLISQKGIGFLIEKEIQMLDQILEQPKSPFVAILGGSKVSDKIGVIENLIDRVDAVLIGGAMAYTFLKAKNLPVGKSLVETEKLNYCRELMARFEARDKSLLLPVDHIVANNIKADKGIVTAGAAIEEDFFGFDIGPQTQKMYTATIQQASTVFWNGPMGVFENPTFAEGTFSVAKALAANAKVFSMIGGGDSAAAVEASGLAEKMSFISTGGGASLEYLQGDKLPGLEVLRDKRRNL